MFDVLKRVRSGDLDPRSIAAVTRRGLVELLWTEGVGIHEMAALLKVCERTILRDRETVREANALQRDPGLVNRMMGDLVRAAEFNTSGLRKMARDSSLQPSARIRAHRAAWRAQRELIETLQSVGILPTADVSIRAQVAHSFDPAMDLVRQSELIESVAREVEPENEELAARSRRALLASKRLQMAERSSADQEAGRTDPSDSLSDDGEEEES